MSSSRPGRPGQDLNPNWKGRSHSDLSFVVAGSHSLLAEFSFPFYLSVALVNLLITGRARVSKTFPQSSRVRVRVGRVSLFVPACSSVMST